LILNFDIFLLIFISNKFIRKNSSFIFGIELTKTVNIKNKKIKNLEIIKYTGLPINERIHKRIVSGPGFVVFLLFRAIRPLYN
jgi:hypothetical protein